MCLEKLFSQFTLTGTLLPIVTRPVTWLGAVIMVMKQNGVILGVVKRGKMPMTGTDKLNTDFSREAIAWAKAKAMQTGRLAIFQATREFTYFQHSNQTLRYTEIACEPSSIVCTCSQGTVHRREGY